MPLGTDLSFPNANRHAFVVLPTVFLKILIIKLGVKNVNGDGLLVISAIMLIAFKYLYTPNSSVRGSFIVLPVSYFRS